MDLLGVLAKSGTKNITTNNTLLLTKAYINTMTPLDLSEDTIQNVVDDLMLEDTLDGAEGIANFLKKNLLMDDYEKLKYICTDASRGSFKYKDICKNLQKDVKCARLFSAVYDPLVAKISLLLKPYTMTADSSGRVDYNPGFTEKSLYFEDSTRFKPELVKCIAKVTNSVPSIEMSGKIPQKFLV